VCSEPLSPRTSGHTTLHFCPRNHGAAIDGDTIESHVHRDAADCGMHDVFERAPRKPGIGKSRTSPWYSGQAMDRCDIEGIEVDVCPVERGVWLDAPEILAIVQTMRCKTPPTEPKGKQSTSDLALDVVVHGTDATLEFASSVPRKVAAPGDGGGGVILDSVANGADSAGEVAWGIVEFVSDIFS